MRIHGPEKIDVPAGSDFPLANLPYGVASGGPLQHRQVVVARDGHLDAHHLEPVVIEQGRARLGETDEPGIGDEYDRERVGGGAVRVDGGGEVAHRGRGHEQGADEVCVPGGAVSAVRHDGVGHRGRAGREHRGVIDEGEREGGVAVEVRAGRGRRRVGS